MSDDIRTVVEGKGEPLALIHGVGANLESWDEVAARLTARYQVVRMDLSGHGRSRAIREPCTLDDFVADVVAALDGAGIGSCHMAGFSLGGMIAQLFTVTYPQRVRRLALISAVAGRTPEERAKVMERARVLREEGIAALTEAAEERWFTPAFRAAHPERIQRRMAELRANDPVSYAHAYQVFAESDVGDRLREICQPTLVVTGENDVGSNPRMARFMYERIPDAELVILPELKHSVLVEASDQIAELLLAFLDAASSKGA